MNTRPYDETHDPPVQFGCNSALLLSLALISAVMRPGALFAQAREQNLGGLLDEWTRVKVLPH